MYRILVCDDEKDIVSAIRIYLNAEGYEVVTASNGLEAVEALENNDIQLVLLDIMMPKMDGIAAIDRIRRFSNVPVIFLTAKSEDADMILGLNLGADDYITKPFNPAELVARVRSNLRRYVRLGSAERSADTMTIGGLELNDGSKTVTLDGTPISLTRTEYNILKLFMGTPGKVMSPEEIYEKVWNEKPMGNENTVAVHIRHLREKIEIDPAHPRYIRVVWGHGYIMENIK